MSTAREFKFACPICHQHIQCDASHSGQILACPTCFRNIIVPQAPSGQTTRLILRAKQAAKKPATSLAVAVQQDVTARPKFAVAAAVSAALLAASAFVLRH